MYIQLAPSASSQDEIAWPLRLWASVLRRAVVDWVLYKGHTDPRLNRFGEDAEYWLFIEPETADLNSFHSVCDILNLPPEVIRGKIRSMTELEVRRLRGMEFGDE